MSEFIAAVIEALFVHFERCNCPGCGGSGWATLKGPYRGQGSYDMVCDECGGQSAVADTSFFVRGKIGA